jgi:hypothetical protein
MALLDTLRGLIASHRGTTGRKYCFPSQETLMELLEKYHFVTICRKTLNNWLGKLQRLGLIFRKRRLTWDKFRSTCYYVLDWGGQGVMRAKKNIGVAKRLAKIFPSREKKITHDKHTSSMSYSGRAPEKSAPASKDKGKRLETNQSENTPGLVQGAREKIRELIGLCKTKDVIRVEEADTLLEQLRARNAARGFSVDKKDEI